MQADLEYQGFIKWTSFPCHSLWPLLFTVFIITIEQLPAANKPENSDFV